MKKKTKVVLITLALLLAAGAYYIFASFNGSLVMKGITTHRVKAYVAQTYPGAPYRVEPCRYDFKCMGYYCPVQSGESEDTRFIVWNSASGMTDDFEIAVTRRDNTLLRLMKAMDGYVDALLQEKYPYRTGLVNIGRADTVTEADYGQLPLDMPFDAKTYPLPCSLTVWVETQNAVPSWDELAPRLRELAALVDGEIPAVEYYSVAILNRFAQKDGVWAPDTYATEVCVYDVPRSVILDGDLESYLAREQAAQAAEREAITNGESDGKT